MHIAKQKIMAAEDFEEEIADTELSDNIDDPVSVYFSENHILFEFDRTSVYSRLIEGEYFHVDNMLNGDTSTKLTVNKKSFYQTFYDIVYCFRKI